MAGNYNELQVPIMQNGDFYYPLTTAKQVILPDKRRLGGENGINLNADDVKALSIDTTDSDAGTAPYTNTNLFDGQPSDKYVKKADNRWISFSLATTDWNGSGTYTATISNSSVTEKTVCMFNFNDKLGAQADINWQTSAGIITLTTIAKPTATLSGYILLVECG